MKTNHMDPVFATMARRGRYLRPPRRTQPRPALRHFADASAGKAHGLPAPSRGRRKRRIANRYF